MMHLQSRVAIVTGPERWIGLANRHGAGPEGPVVAANLIRATN